jgi:aspartyl-tRNA(Asn)/glutamyl-tRNA(Gln) amidotransferase subunit C
MARLAHLGLNESEVETMAEELSSVLDHIERLRLLDVSHVAPTAHASGEDGNLRRDEVRPSWSVEQVLANAPRRQDDLFQVEAVLE